MDFLDNTFIYNDRNSEEYGLYFLQKDVDDNKMVGGVKTYTTQYLKKGHRKTITNSKYTEDSCLSFDAEIFSYSVIDDELYEEICMWLFEDSNYRKLIINSDKYDGIYFNCTLNSAEVIKGGIDDKYGVVGFKFTINCDAPWGWEHQERTFTTTGLSAITTHGVVKGYINPKLTIKTGSNGGDIKIVNITDNNRSTTFEALSPSSTITMISETANVVYSKPENIWEKFKSKKFFRLCTGVNQFSITGDVAQLKIEYEGARLI